MTPERYTELTESDTLPLTEEEIAEGFHFCPDWDGLLVGPSSPEVDSCPCDMSGGRRVRERRNV
jgi:hypothetical protein